MSKANKQCDRILRHLKDYGEISSMDAMREYGIMRLAARIAELREQGHVIETQTVKELNRYGERTRYAVYVLKDYAEVL